MAAGASEPRPIGSPVFSPNPRIEPVRLQGGTVCYIVDDALAEPEAALQYAVERRGQFQPCEPNGYPGVTLALPEQLGPAILNFFAAQMRRHFDARRLMHGMCRYSMVTLPIGALRPLQMLCHRDDPVGSPQYSVVGAVLYLFRDEALGGTSFYEPARSHAEIERLFGDARTMSTEEFTATQAIPRGYMAGSNAYFSRVATVAAKWNRLIFYDASILHSGDILAPQRLSADPATGRLTLNFFFSSRRNLVARNPDR